LRDSFGLKISTKYKYAETVKITSLGQITDALFNVGGQYRRNM